MNTIVQFMKRHYKIIATVVVMAIGLWSFMPKKFSGTDPEKDKVLLEIPSKYIIKNDNDYKNYPNYLDGKYYEEKEKDKSYYEFPTSKIEYYKKY